MNWLSYSLWHHLGWQLGEKPKEVQVLARRGSRPCEQSCTHMVRPQRTALYMARHRDFHGTMFSFSLGVSCCFIRLSIARSDYSNGFCTIFCCFVQAIEDWYKQVSSVSVFGRALLYCADCWPQARSLPASILELAHTFLALQLPPVTRVYVTCCILTTAAVALEVLNNS